MALFYVSAWKGSPSGAPLWTSSVLADSLEQSYRIGKTRFEAENPSVDSADYTLVATGDEVEKSITN